MQICRIFNESLPIHKQLTLDCAFLHNLILQKQSNDEHYRMNAKMTVIIIAIII